MAVTSSNSFIALAILATIAGSAAVIAQEQLPADPVFTLEPNYLGVAPDQPASQPDTPLAQKSTPSPATRKIAPSRSISAEDGWLDISGFLDEAYGFVPLLIPITEPAIGYGAAAALAFLDKPEREGQDGFGRPNITAVGRLATENGT